jgi:hypothetical protein
MHTESQPVISQSQGDRSDATFANKTLVDNPFQEKLPFRVRPIWHIGEDAERICAAHFAACISLFESCRAYVARTVAALTE